MRKTIINEVPRDPLVYAIRALKTQANRLERDARNMRRTNPVLVNSMADEAERQWQAVAKLIVHTGPI